MPLDGYFIPAARGLRRVSADGGVSAEIAAEITKFNSEFKSFKDARAAADKTLNDLIGATDKEAKAAAEAATKATDKVTEVAANLLEIEQKLADRLKSGDHVPAATAGAIFVNSPEYKALNLKPGQVPGAGFSLQVEANTLSGQTGSPPENTDTLVATDRRPGIIPGAFRTLRVRDVIPTIPTVSNAWQFTRELAWTNNAAETRSEEQTSELQSLMRTTYAVFCLTKQKN